jgi:GNAT superfamily N-acetyltransferase
MPTQIRFATHADREVCGQLLAAQLLEHMLPVDPAGIRRGIELALAPHSAAWLLLAMRGGAPVGIALTNRNVSVERGGEALWIEELYVVPEARRTGVARTIVAFLEEEAARHRIVSLELEVVRGQAAAFALYDALGFERLDRQRLTKPVPVPAKR